MTDEAYEFTLQDRIAKIRAINEQYDLENNGYISLSGGKDSMVAHTITDISIPNNRIPRVFINTGVEYSSIRKFVMELSKTDDRIIIINSGVNLKNMLTKEGYPFKSKQHAHNWAIWNNNKEETLRIFKMIEENKNLLTDINFINNLPEGVPTNVKYVYGIRLNKEHNALAESRKDCPKKLKYQFYQGLSFKISDKCCYKLKKEVAHRWEKENNRSIAITGIRGEEGGMRNQGGCTVFDGDNLKKFHPLKVVSEEWENEFIKRENVQLCELYYPPYNFKRTGCKGCPFSLDIANQLKVMYKLLPNEYKQCIALWKPVYDEYIRVGFRLKSYPHEAKKQMTIFDYMEEK